MKKEAAALAGVLTAGMVTAPLAGEIDPVRTDVRTITVARSREEEDLHDHRERHLVPLAVGGFAIVRQST